MDVLIYMWIAHSLYLLFHYRQPEGHLNSDV